MTYRAPLKEMRFFLRELAGVDEVCGKPPFEDASPELVPAILEEAAKLAENVLAPLNGAGEADPPRLVDGQVRETAGFAEAYRQFAEGGWSACSANPRFGGMGLPHAINSAASEMWAAANLSFSICPILSMAAIETLESHGEAELQEKFLENMVSGRWTGTMNLTEPQAGSDLAGVRTRAVPEGDHYRIFGQKIFISWGDHEMAENIVHLVLARIEGAPEGVQGISLFLVPKYVPEEDNTPGERNDLGPIALEKKMGIHGSATCAMVYGEEGKGAAGWLIGEENKGLSYMFTMMNSARLHVGLEGVGLSELATQKAVAFAAERVQGRPLGRRDGAIIHHPDVRRMVMFMKSMTEAARAISYKAAGALDRSLTGEDGARARYELLIPVAKGWNTEVAQDVASLCMQVHGGMGYVEETGAAQIVRDARIMTIYEGTTAIHANDFIGRKTQRDGGAELSRLLLEAGETCALAAKSDRLANAAGFVGASVSHAQELTQWLLKEGDETRAAAAVNFLMGCGTLIGAWLLLKSALAAEAAMEQDPHFHQSRIRICNFYAAQVLPRAEACFSAARRASLPDQWLTDMALGI
ncbi:MAG: acyl-CoA dehydrogenase [Gammaproteobacteria bacterium]|nr:acyl-CoA dehydrogenase [Gammaproteobacteria bacterium]MYA67950.1 acyl-CoA dehydrogenase [Gammaproteobacteria bacterium]MYH45224.1 acyl-CoA dehydrogenase [Gammaproteobacteria bacterium]MYL12462.1 acyl-CoA dehydrogenase [Gammaproteobacteria bacterium]